MTNEEALEIIYKDRMMFSEYEIIKYDEVYGIAMDAIEKQIPKMITHTATKLDACTCPSCGQVVSEYIIWNNHKTLIQNEYCKFCGQHLKWE